MSAATAESRVDAASHLRGLDLLRGVAALAVVMFHFQSRLDFGDLFAHGYLAVDFFFCLSGFVVARAYEKRLRDGRLAPAGFVRLRIVRLMPLVLLGNSLAFAIDVFRPGSFAFAEHLADMLKSFLLSCLLLPTFGETTLEHTIYPLNGPIWSLFFEMIANMVFCVLARTALAGVWTRVVAMASFAVMVPVAVHFGDVHVGTHAETFVFGFGRVGLSFSLGMLLTRLRVRPPAASPWTYVALLMATIGLPTIGARWLSATYDLAAITVAFPLIVAGGAGCARDRIADRIAPLGGDLSYPLYCLHYPLVRVTASLLRGLHGGEVLNIAAAAAVTLAMAGGALAVSAYYDRPVRRWLGRQPTLSFAPERRPTG